VSGPPRDGGGRPVKTGPSDDQAAAKLLDATILEPDDDTLAAQLRRRREAALRLPPLEHLGRSDPWDLRPAWSREPWRLFWLELRGRGLLTDAITAELIQLHNTQEVA
jgi:hypothetical protein